MLKSILRTSLCCIFTGERSIIWHQRNPIFLNRCYAARQFCFFQLNGVKSLRRYLHNCSDEEDNFVEQGSSLGEVVGKIPKLMTEKAEFKIKSEKICSDNCSDEEDDFSELGSPAGEGIGTIPKLMTEKAEFKKSVSARKALSSSAVASESKRRLKNASLKPSSCASAPIILKSCEVNEGSSNFKSSRSVTIENVPSLIQLSQLKEAMSIFGKISNASMRTIPNGLDCCDIQFESSESRDSAVSVGQITVKNFNLPIHPLHALDVVTIRICNIGSKSADSAIHSMCMSCGPLKALVREKEDAVDALFCVKDKSDTRIILEKLNNTIMDNCNWSAHVQTIQPSSSVKTNDDSAQRDLGLKFCNQLQVLKWQICLTRVYTEDLETLHRAILHLQCHPATSTNISNTD